MGKHNNNEYLRPARDLYPTPETGTAALLKHINVAGKVVWECAAGTGRMTRVLQDAGARVYSSDIHQYDGFRLNEKFDFVSDGEPKLQHWDLIVTNPPGGNPRNKLAEKFIEYGLPRLGPKGTLALLLPMDFDSAVTRSRFFENCREFYAKIVIRGRLVWYERNDGGREAPKENSAWYIWQRGVRVRDPIILYADNKQGRKR